MNEGLRYISVSSVWNTARCTPGRKPSLRSFLSPLLPRWVSDLPRALAVEGLCPQGERAHCLGVHISDPTYPFSWGPLLRVQPGLGSQGEGG